MSSNDERNNETKKRMKTGHSFDMRSWPWKKVLQFFEVVKRAPPDTCACALRLHQEDKRLFAQLFVAHELQDQPAYRESYKEFFETVVELVAFPRNRNRNTAENEFGGEQKCPWCLLGGMTQTGKSAVKCLLLDVCNALNLGAVIITKGVAESRELRSKLSCSDDEFSNKNMTTDEMVARLASEDSFLVVADTKEQINRAANAVEIWKEGYRNINIMKDFVVIIDECDEMYRTDGSEQNMEEALEGLLTSSCPLVEIHSSATALPILVDKVSKEPHRTFFSMIVEPDEQEYYGISDLQFMLDDDERAIFLDGKVLDKDDMYEQTQIPYFNKKIQRMYDDAYDAQTLGVLLIDCTSPFVTARHSILEKAQRVQQKYPSACVVAIHALGMDYWIPGAPRSARMNTRVSLLLEHLDETCGLETPIFLFGWNKIRRGMSFRSQQRVPTHFIMYLGDFSVESCIQCLGRATGNYKSVLRQHGIAGILVLTTAHDFDTARRYYKLLHEIQHRLEANGNHLQHALTERPFSWQMNILEHSDRKIGRNPRHRQWLQELIMFEPEPPSQSQSEQARQERNMVCCGADYVQTRQCLLHQTLENACASSSEVKHYRQRACLTSAGLQAHWNATQPFGISLKIVEHDLNMLKSKQRVEKRTTKNKKIVWLPVENEDDEEYSTSGGDDGMSQDEDSNSDDDNDGDDDHDDDDDGDDDNDSLRAEVVSLSPSQAIIDLSLDDHE